MRRWIVLLLLFVLPTQFSWAAAASYCQHGRETTSKHLGHHEHRHQQTADAGSDAAAADASTAAIAGDDGSDFKPQLPGAHADCAYCHFSLAKTLNAAAPVRPVACATSPPEVGTWGATASPIDRIERPNWQQRT